MLQSKAMLANLSISQWTARKQDQAVSAVIDNNFNAHDAGKFTKRLVDKSLLEPIARMASTIREYHNYNTMPWSDGGSRLLPSSLFMEYTSKMRGLTEKFESAVRTMYGAYPAEVRAARIRLGALYCPSDYPDPDDIMKRFAVNLEFFPVPDTQDFRVDVGEEARVELQQSLNIAICERQKGALGAVYKRIDVVLSNIIERLSDEEAIFKDTLFQNTRDLCAILVALNVVDDPELERVRVELQKIAGEDPRVVRTYKTARRRVAEAAAKLWRSLPAHV